ncbi:MAG: bacillithiol system redox-active protein YtxJ [Bacteroidia bacterium]|nr:bacillithiol system redox-active protein YtxJ [Bacteroidia bacterium]MDW8157488.1 bacillithiol system redox-active protein YtxJ [Bacteroidia bacterium]
MHKLSYINEEKAVDQIRQASYSKPQLLFKHSTRCSISFIAKDRIEKAAPEIQRYADIYFLDLLQHRNVSNYIAEIFDVPHQSPQVLVIKDGECILEQSHLQIDSEEILELLS